MVKERQTQLSVPPEAMTFNTQPQKGQFTSVVYRGSVPEVF